MASKRGQGLHSLNSHLIYEPINEIEIIWVFAWVIEERRQK
jgi:hypothetical protein